MLIADLVVSVAVVARIQEIVSRRSIEGNGYRTVFVDRSRAEKSARVRASESDCARWWNRRISLEVDVANHAATRNRRNDVGSRFPVGNALGYGERQRRAACIEASVSRIVCLKGVRSWAEIAFRFRTALHVDHSCLIDRIRAKYLSTLRQLDGAGSVIRARYSIHMELKPE